MLIFITSSIIEALGISLVMPLIALVLEDNFLIILINSMFGNYIPDFIYLMERDEALLFFSISLIFIYIFKIKLTNFLQNILNDLFTGKINAKLSNALMNKYLHQNYLYHSKKMFEIIISN